MKFLQSELTKLYAPNFARYCSSKRHPEVDTNLFDCKTKHFRQRLNKSECRSQSESTTDLLAGTRALVITAVLLVWQRRS